MVKVITYGTYDLLHYGHIRLLERAKALGDYLIVGVTADSFDLTRGKINVQQSLMERIEAVRATGIADEIIVEEYEGQKIDDIKRYNIDIFTVGSDWVGHFDYLKEYCKVVYLDRTEGVSSTEIRSERQNLRLGLVGESTLVNKFEKECHYVNGVSISGICTSDEMMLSDAVKQLPLVTYELDILLEVSDAVYIVSHPSKHFAQIKKSLEAGKHVLCESPITMSVDELNQLYDLARQKSLILVGGLKTAYSTAYNRMLLLAKSGIIGKVVSIDSICTSLSELESNGNVDFSNRWNSICAWGPIGMLPIFQLLGTEYISKQIVSHILEKDYDTFTKVSFIFSNAVASLKVGKGAKSEGELIISGTKGYIFVPAPWWKMDYFEVRYENPANNKRFFYQLDGEGIRFEILSFVKMIEKKRDMSYVGKNVSLAIVKIIEDFYLNDKVTI